MKTLHSICERFLAVRIWIAISAIVAYEIQVDVTVIIRLRKSVGLAFVECKVLPVTRRDVGQFLGYSLVARPQRSYLFSPLGLTDRLRNLLVTLGRQDILRYAPDRSIVIGTWNTERKELDLQTVVPRGSYS